MMEQQSNQPHIAAGISAVAASMSIAAWANDHAVFFTIAAAIAAILSGLAGAFFYAVSTYYKIKHSQSNP